MDEGRAAELAFERLCERNGWVWRRASRHEDRIEHWDYLVQRQIPLKIEVKAAKRLKRRDPEPSQRYTWLEWSGVPRPDGTENPGWLRGSADWIAFQVKNGFLMVRRIHALELATRLAANAEHCQWFRDPPLHQIYDRITTGQPRGSVILVYIKELEKLEDSFLLY